MLDIVLAEVTCAVLLANVSTAYNALQEEVGMAAGFCLACALIGGLTHNGTEDGAL